MGSFRFVAILLVLFVFTKSTADEFNIREDFERRGAKDGKPIPTGVPPPPGKRVQMCDRQDDQKWKRAPPAIPTVVPP